MADDVFDIDGVDALFDGALDDFVARRDALVKALKAEKRKDDAAAVKALRKPSAAAWAINTIARSSRDDMDALLRAGAFVREAQAAAMQGRDDGSLRTSTREWRGQLNALAARAGAHRDDAMVAFEAASTDDTVASVVCAGHLIAVPEAGGLAGLSGMPEPVTRRREPEARELEPEALNEPEAEAEAPMEPEVEAPVEPEPEPEPEPPIFVPAKSIVIVGTPLSGSTLLARALEQTRVMGVPHEYWWRLVEARHADELSVATPTDENYIDYADAALLAGTTGNGVFSCKLFWEHQKDLVRRTGLMPHLADLAPVDRLWALFGPDVRAIYLRRNCLDAALSLWRAEVTDEWGRTDADDAPPVKYCVPSACPTPVVAFDSVHDAPADVSHPVGVVPVSKLRFAPLRAVRRVRSQTNAQSP